MYIFLSHSSTNSKLVEEACNYLEKNGFACFLAPRDIRGGHLYAEELVDGIDRSDVVVLFLSKAADDSPHVLREVERAVSRRIPIVVYKLEEFAISNIKVYINYEGF